MRNLMKLAFVLAILSSVGCESKTDIAREAWRDEVRTVNGYDKDPPFPKIGMIARYADGSEYRCTSMTGKFAGLPYPYLPESLNRNRAQLVGAHMPEEWAKIDAEAKKVKLRGIIVSDEDGKPIEHAHVSIENLTGFELSRMETGKDGKYELQWESTNVEVQVIVKKYGRYMHVSCAADYVVIPAVL